MGDNRVPNGLSMACTLYCSSRYPELSRIKQASRKLPSSWRRSNMAFDRTRAAVIPAGVRRARRCW